MDKMPATSLMGGSMTAEMKNHRKGEPSKEYENVSDDGCVHTNLLFLHLGQPHD
jgi:hypothetical protein